MRKTRIATILTLTMCLIILAGCTDEVRSLKIQNNTQRNRLAELESDIQATGLKYDQSQRQLDSISGRCDIEKEALQQTLTAVEKNLSDKNTVISQMQQQLLYGGAQLPVELSTMLEDFSKTEEMVSYDSGRGVVRFKSDLVFESGSDKVTPVAAAAVESLCKILNTEQGKKFDIIIAGHTDNVRIGKPQTRQKHPSNWHLSAHRAIAVLRVMGKKNIAAGRMSIRGFSEYRPIAPNKPEKGGNPQNRRVEIYIVAKGV